MAAKPVLSSKALKLLEEYSESEGITPSEAVIRLVPKKKPLTAKALIEKAKQMSEAEADKIIQRKPKTKPMPDAEAGKFARDAVRKYRAEKRAR